MTKNKCTRCGKCCAKGGPGLHMADIPLLQKGMIRPEHLVTIRKGELVRKLDETLYPTDMEFIKIRGISDHDWTCRFFKHAEETAAHASMCLLHGRHPEECRVLFCAEPEALMAMHACDRLDREKCIMALVPEEWQNAILELIATHEESCNYASVASLDKKEQQERCRLDAAFREVAVARAGLEEGELLFYFGRPLQSLLR